MLMTAMSVLCLRWPPAAVAFIGAVAALIIPLLPSCAAAAPPAPAVQRRTLPSGMRVIVAEQPGAALAALDLRVRVGSGAETPTTSGTAHFIEHLLFKGTETRKPGDIDVAVEKLGGELKAQTTRDATRFATVLPARRWREALAVMADMTLHPAFRADDVAAEKAVILSEMAVARTDPARTGFDTLAGAVFGPEDPYRLPLMGSEASVKAMTSEALSAFWQQWYRPQNMTLVVSGNVKADEVLAEVERLFPVMPLAIRSKGDGEPDLSGSASPVSTERARIRIAGGEELTTIFVGFRAPAGGEAGSAAVAGLVSLLAERSDGGGGHGRLKDALITRERLALSITADYVTQRGAGLIMLSATALHANAAKLENALLAELEKLPGIVFTTADAAQARRDLLLAQGSDGSVEGTASRLARADVLTFSTEETDDTAKYAARLLRAVTPESLTEAAGKYLAPGQASIVIIGPPMIIEPTQSPVVP